MLPGRQLTIDWTLKTLWRRRWLLVVPLYLGVMGGLLYSRSQPSLYRSDAVVQVVPQRIPDTYVQSTVTERVEDRLTSLAHQVLSRTQLERVILEFGLYPKERRQRPIEDVFALMTSRVQVTPMESASPARPGVDAFRISFDYDDPHIARDVVGKLANFFIDRNAKERGTQADQTNAFLEAQLADARSRLEAQEKKLKEFRERNFGSLPTQVQTNLQAIQTSQLALQAMVESLARDRDRKMMLERLYADAAADTLAAAQAPPASPGDTPAAGDAASRLAATATPRQRLEAAKAALTQMEVRLSPKHPDVIRARHLIEDLEKQVAAEDLQRSLAPDAPGAEGAAPARGLSPEEARRVDDLRAKKAEIESLDRQIAFKEGEEKRLRDELAAYQARLEAVPGTESEWARLNRDHDTLEASYKDLLTKSENSKMAASLEERQIGEQFRILDQPRVPVKPQSPNRIRINLMGTLAGLGLGVLLIGLIEYRDSSMRSEADVLGAIDLPVLVLTPFVTTSADLRRLSRNRRLASTAVVLVLAATAVLSWYLRLWRFVT